MKKLTCIVLILFLLILNACSVQETVSPQIFIQRLQKSDENFVFDIDNAFFEENNYICFAAYKSIDIVFEIAADEQGNAKKINLACTRTDKIDSFISCVQSIIATCSPDDDAQTVISELFLVKESSDKCLYYDTQWHEYSAVLSENGLFFSVESKKFVPRSEVEYSLKQNDIVTY